MYLALVSRSFFKSPAKSQSRPARRDALHDIDHSRSTKRRKTTRGRVLEGKTTVNGFTFKRKSKPAEPPVAAESTVDGFTFKKKQKKTSRSSSKPSKAKGKSAHPVKPVASIPDYPAVPFNPPSYDPKMAESAVAQRFFEDLVRHEIKQIRTAYTGQHEWLMKSAVEVTDQFLNSLREYTNSKEKRKSPSNVLDTEIKAWEELEEKYTAALSEGEIKPSKEHITLIKGTPFKTSLPKAYTKTLETMSTK
eukprot:1367394-Amorphochlora_amoeboformis.AAC.1